MSERVDPPYGERVVSWRTVLQELEKDFGGGPESNTSLASCTVSADW